MKYKNSHDLLVSELEKNGWENGNKPTTMRERFDERFILTQDYEPGVLAKYNVIKDFIEQELKKEREEIEGIVCHQLSLARYGNDDELNHCYERAFENIINTIKTEHDKQ